MGNSIKYWEDSNEYSPQNCEVCNIKNYHDYEHIFNDENFIEEVSNNEFLLKRHIKKVNIKLFGNKIVNCCYYCSEEIKWKDSNKKNVANCPSCNAPKMILFCNSNLNCIKCMEPRCLRCGKNGIFNNKIQGLKFQDKFTCCGDCLCDINYITGAVTDINKKDEIMNDAYFITLKKIFKKRIIETKIDSFLYNSMIKLLLLEKYSNNSYFSLLPVEIIIEIVLKILKK